MVAAGELSPATRTAYLSALRRFLNWWSEAGQPPIEKRAILDWLASLQHTTPNSRASWLAGLRACFRWALSEGLIDRDPTVGIKGGRRRGTSQRHLREPLTKLEVQRLLAAPNRATPQGRRNYAILALMLYTGVRTIEVHRADLDDLRTEQGRLVLYVHGKGRETKDELVVLANPAVQAAVYDWLAARGNLAGPLFTSLSPRSRGERLSLRAIREMVKGTMQSVGIVGARKSTHSLRHTAITTAIEHGAPLMKVQAMSRHRSPDTVMIYYHELDRIQNAAEELINYE